MQKTCSKCGIQFSCQNEMPGCWCEKVKLNEEILTELKENFQNCLCPGCLQGFAERAKEKFENSGRLPNSNELL